MLHLCNTNWPTAQWQILGEASTMYVYSTRPLKAEIRRLSKTRCEFTSQRWKNIWCPSLKIHNTLWDGVLNSINLNLWVPLLLGCACIEPWLQWIGVNVYTLHERRRDAASLNYGSRLAERPRSYPSDWNTKRDNAFSVMTIPIFPPIVCFLWEIEN